MTESIENQQSNGLAIASFVLALVGCFFILLPFVSIICWVLALIFGIIALCKKQTLWAALTGTIISSIAVLISTIILIFVGSFVVRHSDKIIDPIKEFSAWVEENPEIAVLMNNEEFSEKFEDILEERLEEKYGNEYKNINDINGVFDVFDDMFDEMKNIAIELANQEGIKVNIPVDTEISTTEVHKCGDFYKTQEDIVCTEQYAPVCGDNGQTYGNDCFACIEVDSYTDGECTETAPAPVAKLRIQEGQTEEETQTMIEDACRNAGGELVDGNCVLEDGSVVAF